jgi:GntR family transcriptional regulator, transcriptional repressor for pyruvate dehydrogenase complex
MKIKVTKSATEAAAQSLRSIVLSVHSGELIGSEEELISRLGCSRSTVRQVARLLEREGLLKVRRGINGGYFAARPDAGTIEATVSAYLEMLDIDSFDVTVVASALWVEAMRKAANADRDNASLLADRLSAKVKSIKDDASFEKVREIELLVQSEIFDLAQSAYVRLIFDINVAYSRRRFSQPLPDNNSDEHRDFVRAWRSAKLLELAAIAQGDVELAGMAGKHSRKIWYQRILSRFAH